LERNWENERGGLYTKRNYVIWRDIFRFKADLALDITRGRIREFRAFDPHVPFRGGGEMSLFLPTAYWGVDMEAIAELMTGCGTYYPSIHLSWHFDEVDYETVLPVYMMASLATDIFKGGWSASWESTGGPQQFDGGKKGMGFTVDAGVMTQLMLSYLAAGFKGFGFWCWSVRTAGKEAGQYSLLDRNNQVTPRARRVGQIGRAARCFRDELWEARKEPLVGIYVDWNNEAVWAAMSVRGRDVFRQWPVSSRVGVSRTLINADVPFEYVTATDIRKGLTPRYKVIYLPFAISIPRDILKILGRYVESGGRLVADMPFAMFDENTALLPTGRGSPFETIFGVTLNSFQYAGVNIPYRLEELVLRGTTMDVTPTSAKVTAAYDNGKPAVTMKTSGQGHAVLLGYEASMLCFKPGNRDAEDMLLKHTLGDYRSPFECKGAIAYRLAAPTADHYFLINDGPKKEVLINTKGLRYQRATDAVSGTPLALDAPIAIERYSGRWLRAEKPAPAAR
jgi:beta-galactosidase